VKNDPISEYFISFQGKSLVAKTYRTCCSQHNRGERVAPTNNKRKTKQDVSEDEQTCYKKLLNKYVTWSNRSMSTN
jgi:hypothetical protein